MSTNWDLPERGVTFWPVGNGDAITIAIDAQTVMQIDVNHRDAHDDPDDDRVPVVDRLAEVLPRCADDRDRPELTVLAITHHDQDHCSGFTRLIDTVRVDELWITLRSFVEDKNGDGLTDAGQAVYDEAKRRRDAEITAWAKGERAASGDRLHVIGRGDLLNDDDWKGFPTARVTTPGNTLTELNDSDYSDVLDLFIHTPFRDDCQEASRNSSSLGIHLTLKGGDCETRFLLLGDLEYEQIDAFIDKTIEKSNEQYLEWDVLLAPHHCSRNAIRRLENEKWVDADALEHLETYAADGAQVISSSRPFGCQSEGDTDPPHNDARDAYERIVGADALHCTADYAKGNDSEPLTILVESGNCGKREMTSTERAEKLRSIGVMSGQKVRAGDDTGGRGDQQWA